MRISTVALLFLFIFSESTGQTRTEVPHKLHFADMTLTIRDDARREIQKDVDALTQSPRHFNIKAERAKTYFPIIEKVFRDEGVPEDFKYLVLQESALIADAVSVSNAVGFWQFKDFTAVEMGLRVDKEIDERLNIVSSSRAAARYLKKNNGFFNNWLYALQAYQMGAGGVLRSVKESRSGERHMEITSRTYWYVKKYLAHKIAFEGAVSGAGAIQVLTYETQNRKTLSAVAKEVAVEEAELRTYNKWTKSGNIPDDRSYTVLIPVTDKTKTVTLPVTAVASRVPETKNG
ncbi:MAG TPA: lytic transglycosylase domain-containing protein, partial [Ohtaekwangia sp.]|nr:lytic transglycosylase domain-containing protein [Ohtaekwangia sp.]